MGLLDGLANLGKAKQALEVAELARRAKTRHALEAIALGLGAERTPSEKDLDELLAASSQGAAVKEIAKAFGVYDMLRSLIDRLEGKA